MRYRESVKKGAAALLSLILMFAFVQTAGGYLVGALSKNSEPVPDMPVEEETLKQMVLQLDPVEFYTVQIGSYEKAEEGQAIVNELAKLGYRVSVSDGPPYQIWLGCMGKKPVLSSFPEEIKNITADVFVQKKILNETALKFDASDSLEMEQTAALLSSYDVVLRHSLQMFQDFRYEACSEENWADMITQIADELEVIGQLNEQLLQNTTSDSIAEKIRELSDKTLQYGESLHHIQQKKTDRYVLMAQSCLLDVISKYHEFMAFENNHKLYL